MTGGEKRGLDKTAGGEVVMDRMIRRKNRKFSDQADAMRRWLRETDQMYGDDEISDTDSDEEAAEEKRVRREARELEELAWPSTTTTTRRSETTTITTTPTTAPSRRRRRDIDRRSPQGASRPP